MAKTTFRGPVLQGKEGTGFNLVEKTGAYSVLIGDSGKSFIVPKNSTTAGSSVTFTLPTVADNDGSLFTFVNTGADGTNQINITGASGEYIIYKGVVLNDRLIKSCNINTTALRWAIATNYIIP